jgi:uncharacterized membrane protein
MLIVVLALAAVFLVLKVLGDRLSRTERELAALRERLDKLDLHMRPESSDLRPPSPAVARPTAAPIETPAPETPRQDRDLVAALTMQQPVPATRPTSAPHPQESLETVIGSRWLLYVGVVAVVIGVSYFIKLALDNHWVNETGRVVIAGAAGVMLAYAGTRFIHAGYVLYGQILSGAGMAIVYLSVYAAFNFYQLISRPAAFVLMCVVTIAAAWLADRQRSQGLALMAVGGGFATPFLLSNGRDAEVALFTYAAILVAGTMWLARRREWPWLDLLSYVSVVLTLASWASAFYTPDKFLTTEAFLTVFCGMFLGLVYESRASIGAAALEVRSTLWSAPALYYCASLAVLYEHGIALPLFLMVMLAVGIGVAAARPRLSSVIRLASWILAAAPLVRWISEHADSTWFTTGLVVVGGIYAIALLAQLDVIVRKGKRLDDIDLGLIHANGLAAYGGAYLLIDAVHPHAAASTALVFALWHLGLAGWLAKRDRDDALHFAGVAFTLTSIAIAIQFHGSGAIMAWSAEGAAAIVLGLRERRVWFRAGGAALLVVSIVALVFMQFDAPHLGQLVFLNRRALTAMFVIAALYSVAAVYHRWFPESDRAVRPRDVLLVTANALTLLMLTTETAAFWTLREPFMASAERARNARLVREAMISIIWAGYATGLIVAGLRRAYPPIRYFAIVVFSGTILKVFLVDLAELDRIYRVASIIGLGVLLLITSYLYQRARAPNAKSG